MKKLVGIAVLLICMGGLSLGQDKDPWADFGFLLGAWVGDGAGKPGEGEGEFSLQPDLQGKILLRRNITQFPNATHKDLMIIYKEQGTTKAIYFDNEDHTIHYSVAPSTDGKSLVFTSSADIPGPRFRLTYINEKPNSVRIKFEMAGPQKPDEFKTYLEGSAHRK